MMYPCVTLKKGEGRALKAGGAWIYDGEIAKCDTNVSPGDIVSVHDFDGYGLGVGFINPSSTIRVRMFSRDPKAVIDTDFISRRVHDAVVYRAAVSDLNCCRLIFGEADFLPGFIADKYDDVIVVQSLALGIDRFKETIIECLKSELALLGHKIRGVYERSDAKVREKEGMPRIKGFIGEEFDTHVEITENGIRYEVDIVEGQKTGFFLDQKDNRAAIKKLCKGARVLDCFTHTGSFALNAAAAGAEKVIAVDASQLAIDQAKRNAELNGFSDRIEFICADVFDLLPKLEAADEKFDVIILDPPAFTKARESVKKAASGYKEINLRALRLIPDGGYLCTCSCSHFMTPDLFISTVASAAKDAHRRVRQVEYRTQAPDHPILWSNDESYYLKFLILNIANDR